MSTERAGREVDPATIEQNRRMWNETAGIHEDKRMAELLEAIRAGGFSTLDAVEERILRGLGAFDGKRIAQLCCNNARELLSLKLRGAGRCTGFDLSDAFIAQGDRLRDAAGVELELVCASVYDIPASYDGGYDIVYVTIGAIGWLPDLARFFGVVARLLAPGGVVFVYEMHPVLDMLDPDKGFELRHSYFRSEPYLNEGESDYFDPTRVVSEPSYWFHHTLADVIGGCLGNGLAVTRFEEHAHDLSTIFAHLAAQRMLPMCYALVAEKPATR